MSSKGIEEIPDKKLNLANLSERQALLYLQNECVDEVGEKEEANSLLDYHQYFLYKKEKTHSLIDKSKLAERNKMLKQSLLYFQKINKNIYINRKKYGFNEDEAFRCSCTPKKFTQTEAKQIIQSGYENKKEEDLFGCGGSCLNKMVSWECVEGNCLCGASCRNRKFQNHEYAEVYPIKTLDRGFGLCAGTFLPKGTFVIQYIGEVYSTDSEYGRKKLEEYKNNKCTYLMSLSKNEVIDPTSKGNLARFINHSCEPNCETRKWNVLGEVCIGIFTLRDIQSDEELTFNYGFNIFRTNFQKCLCGTPSCKGYLGVVEANSPEKVLDNVICPSCKILCKSSEKVLVCDKCKGVFHKNCAKKGKGNCKNFICYYCIKKDNSERAFLKETKERMLIIDEEPEYDDIYEVDDEELRKIRKNLSHLINCGARLFWDYQQQNAILGTKNKLEIKITGTKQQIEKVKKMIHQLKEFQSDSNDEFTSEIQVPKIFVRKIIGHQDRNLNTFQSKFNVKIDFDRNLITDEIFPIQESSVISVKGKENSVRAVENEIKKYLYNLQVLTIFLIPSDYQFIKANICQLKTEMDPADVRLRKRDYKGDKDIKHPFFYIPNNNKDLVIIGFEKEVEKGEKNITDFLKRLNNLSWNYSLSFLFPIYIHKQLNNFLSDNKNIIKDKKLYFDVIKPEFLRRHLSVYIEGKWNDVIDIKTQLWKELIEQNPPDTFSGNYKKYNVEEFDQYAFNQEHKLTSKVLKNYTIEQNTQIKYWDCISVDIEYLKESLKKKESNLKEEKNEAKVLKSFASTCDRDTKLNYLLNFPPGSYGNIFNYSQRELMQDLFESVGEMYKKYKDSKGQENTSISVNSDNKESPNEINSDIDILSKTKSNDKLTNSVSVSSNRKDEEKEDTIKKDSQEKKILTKNNPLSAFSNFISKMQNYKDNEVIREIHHHHHKNNDSHNISYNFSNISQMNINININDINNYRNTIKNDNMKIEGISQDGSNEYRRDSEKRYLRKKIRRSECKNFHHHHHHNQRESKNYYPCYERRHHDSSSSHHKRRGYYDKKYMQTYSRSDSSKSSSSNKKRYPSFCNNSKERGYNAHFPFESNVLPEFRENFEYKKYPSNSERGYNIDNGKYCEEGRYRKSKNF